MSLLSLVLNRNWSPWKLVFMEKLQMIKHKNGMIVTNYLKLYFIYFFLPISTEIVKEKNRVINNEVLSSLHTGKALSVFSEEMQMFSKRILQWKKSKYYKWIQFDFSRHTMLFLMSLYFFFFFFHFDFDSRLVRNWVTRVDPTCAVCVGNPIAPFLHNTIHAHCNLSCNQIGTREYKKWLQKIILFQAMISQMNISG